MKKILTLLLVCTGLNFNGCAETKTVYVNSPCPKLKQWKVEPLGDIKYKVVEIEEEN